MIKYKGLSLRIITSGRAEADTNKLSYLPHDDDWMLINARQWRPSAEPACGGDKGCTNSDSLRTEECQIYEEKKLIKVKERLRTAIAPQSCHRLNIARAQISRRRLETDNLVMGGISAAWSGM